MKRALWVTIVLMTASTASFAVSKSQKEEPNQPSAQELLKKYAQTQDSIRSFILKEESVSEADGTYFNGKPIYMKNFDSIETRFDGSRFSRRAYSWGTNILKEGVIKKEDAYYRSSLYDGKDFYNYSRSSPNMKTNGYPGILDIVVDKKVDEKVIHEFVPGITSNGYMGNNNERVDSFLSKEKKVAVREKQERIGGSDCFVIDAQTSYGKYIIWIDPTHGYNIAQSEIQRKEGDVDGTGHYRLAKGMWERTYLYNVRFEKINNIWVPVENDSTSSGNMPPTGPGKVVSHYKIAEMKINPSSEALGLFKPDDVLDGSSVRFMNALNMKGIRWMGGKAIDRSGKVIKDLTEKNK